MKRVYFGAEYVTARRRGGILSPGCRRSQGQGYGGRLHPETNCSTYERKTKNDRPRKVTRLLTRLTQKRNL